MQQACYSMHLRSICTPVISMLSIKLRGVRLYGIIMMLQHIIGGRRALSRRAGYRKREDVVIPSARLMTVSCKPTAGFRLLTPYLLQRVA